MKIKILDPRMSEPQNAPSYQTSGAAGMDLRVCFDVPVTLQPGETRAAPCGVAIYIEDPRLAGMIVPRSGMGAMGIVLANTIGLIDSDYQGELVMMLHNRSERPVVLCPMQRVAQLVIIEVARPVRFEQVTSFEPTQRGAGGFGSTGAV